MTDNDAALQDDRLARVMLAIASEPGDVVTGRLIRAVGPSETVRLALASTGAGMSVRMDLDAWQRRVGPRLSEDHARRAMETSDRFGMRMLVPGDEGWPESMQRWHNHGPIALWVMGAVEHLSAPSSVGIVGARAATGYGGHVAGELASGSVGAGLVVVSGGAYGIDAAAHRAALISDGTTVAVLPGGLDRLYPAGNQQLLEQVAQTGALVSEIPPGASPTKHRLEQRGRLIAALSSAVVVVEAGYRSGALVTAAQAAQIGRKVGAVPGPITSAASAGCHRLMRDEIAEIVTGMDDVTMMLRRAGAYPPRTLISDVSASVQISPSSPARATGPSLRQRRKEELIMMDRSLNDGRQFGPYGQELFDDHVSQLLEGGGLVRRLGNAHAPRVGWADLSARIGRNDKPGVLFSAVIIGALSDRELRKGLEDTWTTCEWPGRAADHEVWVQLFELAGVDEDHYLHETEVRDRARLPESLQLFRAAAEGHQTGLSWTTSFERAHWFGTRLGALGGRHHEIYEATVPRDAVLATFHETRGEQEYVIDTGRLDQVIPDVVEPAEWEYLLEAENRLRATDE